MNGIEYAITHLHIAEKETHRHLLRLADTYSDEAEIRHVSLDLATWSQEHMRLIAAAAERLELQLDGTGGATGCFAHRLREVTSRLTKQRPGNPGLFLLTDLHDLFLQASDSSLRWEMLAQISQAKHYDDLLALAERCHPQTLRQVRWANTMLKTQTPQILSS